MKLLKTPDGAFYVQDADFEVDYANNVIKLKPKSSGGDFLPLAGGKMEANAVIDGETKLTVGVGDNHVEVSPLKVEVTLGGNAKLGVFENTIDAHESAFTNVNSISGGSAGLAIETETDMNNHKITGLLDPTDPQDAMTKRLADETYATKDAASASKYGLVKQGAAVTDASGDAETKLNALLLSLRDAGIIAK